MTVDEIERMTMKLTLQAEALAALGAHLELGGRSATGHPALAPRFEQVAELLGAKLDGLTPGDMRRVAGTVRAFFLQAAEMLRDPECAPGWRYKDPDVLQATGASSEAFPVILEKVAHLMAGVSERLAAGARFLDVGTGVARLAIASCKRWPSMRVVGLEPWPPSLAIAMKNVAEARLEDRIELRAIRVEELNDPEPFHLVWLPGPYLPSSVLPLAAQCARRALAPGGWVILGVFGSVPDPLALAVTELRVVRSGGDPLRAADGERVLTDAGFREVRALGRSTENPMDMVLGRA
jgi:SAM-dependent methyltransferase